MRLSFYDPHPFANEYVSRKFLEPMMHYARDKGISHKRTDALVPEYGYGVVCNADYLDAASIRHFRDNDCPIFAFSCIDSAYLSESLRHLPEAELIDRIFMVSGVQTTNISNATVIDSEFNISTEKRTFLGGESWAIFNRMREAGTLQSLPYVPWDRYDPPGHTGFEQRRPTILFRGGNHFFRVLGYLFALRHGLADPESGFQARAYFADNMDPRFRFCDSCRAYFKKSGQHFPPGHEYNPKDCTSPAPWGDVLDLSVTGLWNNRCPASYYWLAEQFQKRHGAINFPSFERALNYESQPPEDHLRAIAGATFYADAKWEFSINMAQRFWEAAAVGTINLIPRRANDQQYFPFMQDGEHYLTFADDFSDIGQVSVEKEQFDRITANAQDMYERWIRPTDYGISTNLLRHIFDLILSKCAS